MFRIVARQFYYYSQSLCELPPDHDECPSECPATSSQPNGFCESCPVKEAKQNFEEFTIDELKLKCPSESEEYSFNDLLNTVLDVSALENVDPSKWTIKTARLVQILKNERNRIERINAHNRRKPE